jgi:hypothetical protein
VNSPNKNEPTRMLSHVFVGVTDFERAFGFCAALMGEPRLKLRFRDEAKPWAGCQGPDAPPPHFLLGTPLDGHQAAPADYHGAYFRDPDGSKLRVCCHTSSNTPSTC